MIIPHVQASRIAISSRRAIRSQLRSNGTSADVRQFRRLLIGLALFLLPLSQGELVAQQAPPFGQGWSHSDSYGTYAPEPGYDQRSYPRPQPFPQQAYQSQPYSSPDQGYQQTGVQPLGAEQLEQLVAPIALYPDVLLAQVLTASTYPDQVRYVDQWCRAQGNAPAEDIAAGADEKNWDPSLKALTAFPQVLGQMARNLPWTGDLGNAYYNQPQDVLGAVQALRQRAQAAGNLQSTPQEAVNYNRGNIELAPSNPDVVQVPSYDPWNVYGRSVSPYPGFSLFGALGQFLGSSPVSYGLGTLMTVFNHTPWGWLSWGLSWLTQSVLFQNNNYYSHSATVADWGLPHGGPRAFRGYQTAGYMRPRRPLGIRNGFRPPATRPLLYSRQRNSFGPGSYRQTAEFHGVRAGSVYSRPNSIYRQPETSYTRPAFRPPIYRSPAQGYRGSGQRTAFAGGYPGKANRSGGFHLFGGGHSSKSFSGGSHKANFGGGHGMFGGHSGGHFGGHGGGGGHSHGHHH